MPIIIDDPPPVGSYITIYVDDENYPVRNKSDSTGTFSGCRVIATDSDGDAWLGFLPGEKQPAGVPEHTAPLPTTFTNATRTVIPGHDKYLCYMMYNKVYEYHSIDGTPPSVSEGPCKVCGRTNDRGISICWFCEIANPC